MIKIIEERPRIIILLILTVLTGVVMTPFLHIGMVINDDIEYDLLAKKGFSDFWEYRTEVFNNQGRTNHVSIIWYFIPWIINNNTFTRVVSFLLVAVSIACLAYFLNKIFRSESIGFLAFLIGITGLQMTWDANPFLAFPGLFSIPAVLLIISLCLLLNYISSKKKVYFLLSLLLYLVNLFTYEMFILYLPLYIAICYIERKKLQSWIQSSLWFCSGTAGYLVIYYLHRMHNGSIYRGNVIGENLSVFDSLHVIYQLSIAAIPAYFRFNPKYMYLYRLYSEQEYYNVAYEFITPLLNPLFAIKAIIVLGVTIYLVYKLRGIDIPQRHIAAIAGFGVVYFFIPPLLVSLTPMYIEAISRHNQLIMPTTYFSFLSLIVVLIAGIVFLLKIISVKYLRIVACLIGILISYISLNVDYVNDRITHYQQLSAYKWKTMESFYKTNVFNDIPEGSLIYAPSLWRYFGSDAISDGYWRDYTYVQTGKRLRFEKDISKIFPSSDKVYYLKYSQLKKDRYQTIIFAEIDSHDLNDELYSSAVKLMSYSKYDDFTFVGSTRELVPEGKVIIGGKEIAFSGNHVSDTIQLGDGRAVYDASMKIISVQGQVFKLNSIALMPAFF